jgi:hypothetical protein
MTKNARFLQKNDKKSQKIAKNARFFAAFAPQTYHFATYRKFYPPSFVAGKPPIPDPCTPRKRTGGGGIRTHE